LPEAEELCAPRENVTDGLPFLLAVGASFSRIITGFLPAATLGIKDLEYGDISANNRKGLRKIIEQKVYISIHSHVTKLDWSKRRDSYVWPAANLGKLADRWLGGACANS